MTRYQVHYEYVSKSMARVQRGVWVDVARTESEVIAKVKRAVPSSFGHWVNRLANEVVNESR